MSIRINGGPPAPPPPVRKAQKSESEALTRKDSPTTEQPRESSEPDLDAPLYMLNSQSAAETAQEVGQQITQQSSGARAAQARGLPASVVALLE